MTNTEITRETQQWLEYAVRWSMHQQQREMQANGLSHAKLHTLIYLSFRPGTRLVDLARYTGVSGAATTQLVDGMEAQGLIRRDADPADKRIKTLTLTEKGTALVETFKKNRFGWLKVLTESFTPEEAEKFRELSAMLNRKVLELFPDLENEIETSG